MKIGFIGLGRMGTGMAKNLLAAGHTLFLYNRTREKAEALASPAARVVSSPAEAAREADAVFTMLADDHAVAEVTFADGLIEALPRNAIHLSSSTISTALSRRLAEEHGARGRTFVAAPVFGRPEAAAAKKLLVVLAGDPSAIERCRPLADAIGRQTFVAGFEPWQANALKLGGNFMIASMLEAFSEAFALMRRSNIAEQQFLDVMSELFGSPVYKNYGSTIVERRFDPAGFALKLGYKDVRLALEAAAETSTPMPFAGVLRDQLLNALAHGQQDLDWSSIALAAARNAGLSDAKQT
ncbi:MAG TPA: NAD(P)-dependent oxidoreductase [Bryobacteraceae bacterium]|jgi:3-hydroxyisobutyrate dehydrogenase-like beta-hydroxyacid dehydrogenase|nr:NAD(P)-dependent oxidoreductase [Bryobacteraceae bacterium]